jgi:predicted  nucleic acid-binding Zn-ribbon protein
VSYSERPDLVAFQELEQLILALADEMAGWRRRAQEAEAKLKAPPATGGRTASAALEKENRELRERLDTARGRTKQLMDKLRFLRQQQESEAHR